jgi:hypothetical protein
MQIIVWRLFRWLFGAFYLLSGLHWGSVLLGLAPVPDFKLSEANAAFQGALTATGFINPLLALTFIVSGACLLWARTAPLGIVLIAPVMVIILFTNTLLENAAIWGIGHTLALLILAWHFRTAFYGLWNYKPVNG